MHHLFISYLMFCQNDNQWRLVTVNDTYKLIFIICRLVYTPDFFLLSKTLLRTNTETILKTNGCQAALKLFNFSTGKLQTTFASTVMATCAFRKCVWEKLCHWGTRISLRSHGHISSLVQQQWIRCACAHLIQACTLKRGSPSKTGPT